MNIKALALIFTLLLLLFGTYFLVENYKTCYVCNPSLASKTFPEVHNKIDVYFAILNFVVAMISVYLISKRKFNSSVIMSGIVAGVQIVAFGTVSVLAV